MNLYASPRMKSGQTLIFMTLVVVMLAFAALFYFDVNKVLHVKGITRNGGDAAALAAARWQAISLNLIGSLNVAQAQAILNDVSQSRLTSPDAELISDLQARIHFSGPLHGLAAAQQAAKLNGLHDHSSLDNTASTMASLARGYYDQNYSQPFDRSSGYTSAWQEVADMYQLVVEQGMAVEATPQYRSYAHYGHLLLNPSFYEAIEQQNWCWFRWNAFQELQEFTDYTYWEELPDRDYNDRHNPHVLSLHLDRRRIRYILPALPTSIDWEDAENRDWEDIFSDAQDLFDFLEATNPSHPIFSADLYGSYYDSSQWGSWSAFLETTYNGAFPWDRDIRPEYDYTGADASMNVRADSQRRSGSKSIDQLERYPAAKPFGSLPGEQGQVRPDFYGMVLPAYTDVRLIPRGTSPSSHIIPPGPGWYSFISFILPRYLDDGSSALDVNNRFARLLLRFEERSFRREGIDWLLENEADCYESTGGGGGGSGGGTRIGY